MPNYKKKSNKQEKAIAKDIGGRPTIASGALFFQKADCRSDKYLVECKITEKTYYSLTTKVWEKIRNEALRDSMRIPVMNIQLRDGKNSIAVIEWNDLIALTTDLTENFIFVGNPVPEIIDAKSYRITPDFLYEDFPQVIEEGQVYYHRHDFKFMDVDKKSKIVVNRHLVMLDWEDYLRLIKEDAE